MIMDIKLFYFLAFTLLFCSCDPSSREIKFSIENKSSKTIGLTLFKDMENFEFNLSEANDATIIQYNALGGGFNAIADFDSIRVINKSNNKRISWSKPSNSYGYIDENIGEERTIPKDIYNRKNWLLEMAGDDEHWLFEIYEKELDLFE